MAQRSDSAIDSHDVEHIVDNSNPLDPVAAWIKDWPLSYGNLIKNTHKKENSQDNAFSSLSTGESFEETADEYLHRDESLHPRRQIR